MRWISFRWRKAHASGVAVLASLALAYVSLAPRGAMAAYTEQVLYRFCSQANCADGKNPAAAVIMDAAGNLYGTTVGGGANNAGVVFKLTQTGSGWTYKVLYSFCSKTLCADGGTPNAGLIMDAAGNLYGTTTGGGPNQSTNGVVFKLAPNGSSWTETVIYNFCSQTNCADGARPYASLIMDAGGNLYGTTAAGGNGCYITTNGCGIVFELTPSGSAWTEKVLYKFCLQSGNCSDGAVPYAPLMMDGAGNLYGTTFSGGLSITEGVAFKLAPSGSSWTETVLYYFGQQGCYYLDPCQPRAGLIMDEAGNLYGTSANGYAFRLSPSGTSWMKTTLSTVYYGSDASLIM